MPDALRRSLWRGDYEGAERAIIRRIVKPGDRVLEGGGGLGLVSMALARIVGPENLLVYEASPTTFSLMTENFRANNLNVTFLNKALADSEGTLTFHTHDNVLSSSTIDRGGLRRIEIPADDIAAVVTQFKPTALVLDIEGSEINVIERAPLDHIRVLIAELHPHLVGDQALVRLYRRMFDCGFVLNHDNCWGRVAVFLRP